MFNGKKYKVKDEVRDSVVVIEKQYDDLESHNTSTTHCKERSDAQEYPQGMTENKISPILITLKTYKEMTRLHKVIYFLPFIKSLIKSIISEYKSI